MLFYLDNRFVYQIINVIYHIMFVFNVYIYIFKCIQYYINKSIFSVPSSVQCLAEEGFCLAAGDRCEGTVNVLQTSLEDQCFCCVQDEQGAC